MLPSVAADFFTGFFTAGLAADGGVRRRGASPTGFPLANLFFTGSFNNFTKSAPFVAVRRALSLSARKSRPVCSPKRAIAFELFLREELVERGLVREAGVGRLVVHDVVVLIAAERSLDIDEETVFARAFRRPGIADRAERHVRSRVRVVFPVLDVFA